MKIESAGGVFFMCQFRNTWAAFFPPEVKGLARGRRGGGGV